MNLGTIRRAADYGGIFSSILCGIHCAAGPLLVWAGAAARSEGWELGLVGLSGVLVVLATRQHSSGRLRATLWGLYTAFAAAALLAERWPWLQAAQYAASAGLIVTHWLNQRHCRRCLAQAAAAGCLVGGPLVEEPLVS